MTDRSSGPRPNAAQKIDEKQKNILNIWMERDGTVFINDQPVPMDEVSTVVAPLYASSDRSLVISIRGDRDVPYRFMDLLQKELVAAGVVRVVFASRVGAEHAEGETMSAAEAVPHRGRRDRRTIGSSGRSALGSGVR